MSCNEQRSHRRGWVRRDLACRAQAWCGGGLVGDRYVPSLLRNIHFLSSHSISARTHLSIRNSCYMCAVYQTSGWGLGDYTPANKRSVKIWKCLIVLGFFFFFLNAVKVICACFLSHGCSFLSFSSIQIFSSLHILLQPLIWLQLHPPLPITSSLTALTARCREERRPRQAPALLASWATASTKTSSPSTAPSSLLWWWGWWLTSFLRG